MPVSEDVDDLNGLFQSGFGLTWERRGHRRTTFQFNWPCNTPNTLPGNVIHDMYSMEAVHIKGALPLEKMFSPIPAFSDFQTLPAVTPQAFVDNTEAATVCAKVGDGFLVYMGDTNFEIKGRRSFC